MDHHSTNSKHSTPRYRAVSANSEVDESLFGRSNSGTLKNTGRRIVTGPVAPNAVVISQHELDRLKNEAIIKTEADILAEREHALAVREEKEKKARERKMKMLELEKRAAALAKKSDMEIADIARKDALKAMAAEQMDQNSDVVKMLNSIAMKAAAYSIRDKQLEDKKRIEEQEKEFDRRMDVMIEMDRLKDIQRREQEEIFKRTKRVEDRKVINEQIDQRQRQRMLALEAREQENQAMRNLMKKYEDEDAKNAALRQIEIEKSKVEVVAANEEAIRRKREAREREKKEMEDILLYQAMKDAELAKREEEEAEIARAKKERQAKLLAQQERVQSNAGKLDELRARRAAEERERRDREKQKEEAIKRKAEMKELLESRAKQAADKIERQKALKAMEQEEIMYQMQYTKKMDDREAEEARIKREKTEDFRVKLHKQIEDIEAARARIRANPGDGMNIREELIKEEERLKVIRDKMVRDLEREGVNPKYLTEMKNVDIGKMLRR